MYVTSITRRYRTRSGRRAGTTLAALGVALMCAVAVTTPIADAALAYGPYTCKSGYVWRVVADDDLVCVTPADRDSVRMENQSGPSRTVPDSVYCLSGYVWRQARPSDLVCVPPASRERERWNNLDTVWRMEDPSATPRGGVSVSSTRTSMTTGAGYLDLYGGGLSRGGSALICSVDTLLGTKYPCEDLGSLQIDWNGYISGRVAWWGCDRRATAPSTIVVLDERSGRVNTAGTSSLIICPS